MFRKPNKSVKTLFFLAIFVNVVFLCQLGYAADRSFWQKRQRNIADTRKPIKKTFQRLVDPLKIKIPEEYGTIIELHRGSNGIEERHIDSEKHKKNPSTVRGSITLAGNIIKLCREEGLAQPCKLALQTGTMHGVGGKIDFGIFERHQKAAEKIGIFVFVQHGTSTIKDREDFAKLPPGGVGEAHLATEYQKIHLGTIARLMPDLAAEMGKFMEKVIGESEDNEKEFRAKWNNAFDRELQQGKSPHEIITEILSDTLPEVPEGEDKLKGSLKDLAKEVSGPFNDQIWNLPKHVEEAVVKALDEEFSFVIDSLGVPGTKDLVESIIPIESIPEIRAEKPHGLKLALARCSGARLASNQDIYKILASTDEEALATLPQIFTEFNSRGALADTLTGIQELPEYRQGASDGIEAAIDTVLERIGINRSREGEARKQQIVSLLASKLIE